MQDTIVNEESVFGRVVLKDDFDALTSKPHEV